MTKTKATYTPGPWELIDDMVNGWGNDEDGMEVPIEVAIVSLANKEKAEHKANASLIATAPEQNRELKLSTDVLRGLLSYFDPGQERTIIEEQIKRNDAAIARAEGR